MLQITFGILLIEDVHVLPAGVLHGEILGVFLVKFQKYF